jgi:hypothetical protein
VSWQEAFIYICLHFDLQKWNTILFVVNNLRQYFAISTSTRHGVVIMQSSNHHRSSQESEGIALVPVNYVNSDLVHTYRNPLHRDITPGNLEAGDFDGCSDASSLHTQEEVDETQSSAGGEGNYDTPSSNPRLVSGIFAISNPEGASPPAQPSEVASPSDSGESASDQSDENWLKKYRWYILAGVGVGLAVATGCGIYFGFLAASTSSAGNTTATPTTPDSTPATAPSSVEPTSPMSHSSTDILSTKTTTTDKMTSAIEQSSTPSTRSSKPHSSTGAMSTMTTEKITSSTKKPVCAQQSGVLFPMEIDQLSDEVVSGQKTTIDNVFFGMKGSSLIKITGLQSGDQIYAFDGHKVASGPDRPVEITGYAKETDIAIIATSTGSRDLKITATNGDGEALTCQETVTVTPKSDAHVFYARTPAARAAAAEVTAEVAAGG